MQTIDKMRMVEDGVQGKLDQSEADKAWPLLARGVAIDRIIAMINGGTLMKTNWAIIPIG